MNIQGIRKILLRFERAVNKNQDQRSKYPDDPTKYDPPRPVPLQSYS